MIPERWSVPITCDCCGEVTNLLLESDRIDEDGLDMCIEEALRDNGWEARDRYTFCFRCVEKALTIALQGLARDADKKKEASS